MKSAHRIALAAATLGGLVATYSSVVLPQLRRWGATGDEVSRPLPGDDLIPDPLYVTTHAISVDAAAEDVWPWLVQMGQTRGGFYTYDALENLFRLDIHSADHIHPEWQDLEAGRDSVTLDPNGTLRMTITTLDPPRAFVIRTGAPGQEPPAPGDFFKGEIAASWAFILEPVAESACRLVIRWRASWHETVPAALVRTFLLEPAHFIMEEGMLHGIRDRAERAATAS